VVRDRPPAIRSSAASRAKIAPILMGQAPADLHTAHIDTGDYVIVTNCREVVFTGNKWQQKSYQR